MERNACPTARQWKIVAPFVPRPKPGGRPAVYPRREIVKAILYQVRNGGTWRALPHDFPPYGFVFHYFCAWLRLHDALRTKVRRQAGRRPKPSVAILDSQTVQTAEQGGRGGVAEPSRSEFIPTSAVSRIAANANVGINPNLSEVARPTRLSVRTAIRQSPGKNLRKFPSQCGVPTRARDPKNKFGRAARDPNPTKRRSRMSRMRLEVCLQAHG
jgi:transposase